MSVALVVVAALPAFALVLLAPPVELTFRVEGIEPFGGQIAVRGWFGLARFRIRLGGAVESHARPATASTATGPRAEPARRRARPNILSVLRQQEFRRRVLMLSQDLLDAVRVRELVLHLRLGAGDPADTGWLWAIVGPLSLLARRLRHAEVHIEPSFADAVLAFDARGRVTFLPLRIAALAIGFALSRSSIRAWRTLRRSHA